MKTVDFAARTIVHTVKDASGRVLYHGTRSSEAFGAFARTDAGSLAIDIVKLSRWQRVGRFFVRQWVTSFLPGSCAAAIAGGTAADASGLALAVVLAVALTSATRKALDVL